MTNGEKNIVRIGEAAKILNVTIQTLRNWEKSGKLKAQKSIGKHRYYNLQDLKNFALDLQTLGLAWATSALPPELPKEFYSERPDRFTSRVAKMGAELQQSKNVSEYLASLLTLVAGEIGDNSFAHNVGNWPDVPGIFYAYDITKRIIILADRGRGVKATLQQIRPSLATDVEAMYGLESSQKAFPDSNIYWRIACGKLKNASGKIATIGSRQDTSYTRVLSSDMIYCPAQTVMTSIDADCDGTCVPGSVKWKLGCSRVSMP
jgi:DNA-binding transcriptional MerR regulator